MQLHSLHRLSLSLHLLCLPREPCTHCWGYVRATRILTTLSADKPTVFSVVLQGAEKEGVFAVRAEWGRSNFSRKGNVHSRYRACAGIRPAHAFPVFQRNRPRTIRARVTRGSRANFDYLTTHSIVGVPLCKLLAASWL